MVIGGGIIFLLLVVVIFVLLIVFYNLLVQDLNSVLVVLNVQYWFGIDEFGWDIFSCLVYGFCIMFYIVLLVLVIVGLFGLLLGVSVGYFGGKVDMVLMCVIDIFIFFLSLVLVLVFVVVLGLGLEYVVIVIMLIVWLLIVCLVCVEMFFLCQVDFIFVVCLQGVLLVCVFWCYIVLLCLFLVIICIIMNMVGIILIVVGLGFFGFGVQLLELEWGVMIFSGCIYMMECWWVVIILGLVILINSLVFNFLGDGLCDIFDFCSE